MSLTGRFSTLFLSALGLVLVAFSATLYVSARIYFDRQQRDRLSSALAILAAAAEIHPEGVEWEPQERVLPLGQEAGPDRLRWIVFDGQGRRVDHSRNLDPAELTPEWTPRAGNPALPGRLVDRRHRTWRVSQRRLEASSGLLASSSAVAGEREPSQPPSSEVFFPSLVLTVCAPLYPMEATLTALGWLLIAASVGTWLFSTLLCRRLSRSALVPLSRLVESARGLDARDPGWRLDEPGTRDELDDLGRAFNDLLARLHMDYQRQRQFSSDASHQLRTPLTVLIGQIQVALRHERSALEYRGALKAALGRAVQLAQLVEALLFLARADADAAVPGALPLELTGWVAEHLALRSPAGGEGEIVFHAAAEALWVRAAPSLLGQLLDNLLDNACKHGEPGARVRVETRGQGRLAILAVEDSGPGIRAEDIPRLFEPFYRSAQARRQRIPGAGLGLAVAQRIAAAMGGSVTVKSEVGVGSRFEVRFPLEKPPVHELDDPAHPIPLAHDSSQAPKRGHSALT